MLLHLSKVPFSLTKSKKRSPHTDNLFSSDQLNKTILLSSIQYPLLLNLLNISFIHQLLQTQKTTFIYWISGTPLFLRKLSPHNRGQSLPQQIYSIPQFICTCKFISAYNTPWTKRSLSEKEFQKEMNKPWGEDELKNSN